MGALYLITGNEEFSVKERAGELVRSLCGDSPEDNPALEIIRGDNETERFHLPLDQVLDSLETPPFLCPEKFIWLKHYTRFDEAGSENSTKKKPSRLDRLAALIKEGLPPDVTLIMDIPCMDRRKAFFKLCEKACTASGGKLEWFEKADPKSKGAASALIQRIRMQADKLGRRMDDETAAFLSGMIGGDAAALHNELEKLAVYTEGSDVITTEDCAMICSRSAETLSWEFSGALAERDPAKALELIPGILETLIQERGASSRPEMALVSAVNTEFKRLLSVRCEGRKFNIPDRASADYFYRLSDQHKGSSDSPLFSMHPFFAFKTWQRSSHFTDAELAAAFQAILDANLAMVTGSEPRLALENLVRRIAGTGGRS